MALDDAESSISDTALPEAALTEGSVMTTASSSCSPRKEAEQASSSLEDITLLSLLAEQEFALQGLRDVLFQIQELRHSASSSNDASKQQQQQTSSQGALTPVDAALVNLTDELDKADAAWDALKHKAEVSSTDFIRSRVDSLDAELLSIHDDVDLLRSELSEDKYLTIFKSVSNQADEMMTSLEKILSSCQDFVTQLTKPAFSSSHAGSSSSSSAPSSSLSPNPSYPISSRSQSEQYQSLCKSLKAKKTYYVPSTERVLAILGQGIAERRTHNGLVLKHYNDMKARFARVQQRVSQVEDSMSSLKEQLQPTNNNAALTASSLSSSPRMKRSPELSSSSSPPRSSPHHEPSPGSRFEAPFKKWASRMASSTGTADPSNRVRSDSESNASVASSSAAAGAKPRKSDHSRMSFYRTLGRSSTPSQRPHTQRAGTPGSESKDTPTRRAPLSSRLVTVSPSERPHYDLLPPQGSTSKDSRPVWNSSVRRLSDSPNKRSSLATLGLPNPSTPSSRPQPRASSAFGHYTPASAENRYRSFTPIPPPPSSASVSRRAPSPAFSHGSAATSPAAKRRPASRNSRIPGPPSAQKPRKSAFGSDVGSDDGYSEAGDSSMLSRAMSPGPSDFAYFSPSGSSRSKALPQSDDHELEEVLSSSREPDQRTRGASRRQSRSNLLMTPEPMMRATASRVNNMTQRPSMRPPSAAGGRRSRASVGGTPGRSSAPSPLPGFYGSPPPGTSSYGMQDDGSYKPNPYDQLDLAIADIMNRQPLHLSVERMGQPLTKQAGLAQKMEDWTAQYVFQGQKPLPCKVIQKTRNGEVTRKCMIRTGGQWVDLELWLLDLQAF